MESQFQLEENGQQVQQDDLDLLGEVSALADDRVFAEILRLAPYDGSVSRAILPYGHAESGDDATVAPNGASGTVLVRPFRAVVGSRTLSDALANWRDIRSGIHAGSAVGGTEVTISANASGNPRWDLIYAAVAVDANGVTDLRFVKDPVTLVAAEQAVTLTKVTTVAVGIVAGTAAASPTFPATPSDSGSTYYVPLAYVRVPSGFTSTATVLEGDIAQADTVVSLSRAVGASSSRPASRSTAVTSAQQQSWGSTGTRPSTFMPASMRGTETVLIPVDTSLASDVDSATLDNSVDWRNRLVRWTVALAPNGEAPPWVAGGDAFSPYTHAPTMTASTNACLSGVGQTFNDDTGTGRALAALVAGEDIATLPNGTKLGVYCDTTTGDLKLYVDGAVGNLLAFFWLELTAPFANR